MSIMNRLVILVLPFLVMASALLSWAEKAATPREPDAQSCTECHEEMVADHRLSVHQDVSCLSCHREASKEDHEKQQPVNCRQCHSRHDERVIHDAHSRVSCIACHMKNGLPKVQAQTNHIIWSGKFAPGEEFRPHQGIRIATEEGCRNCHVHHNSVGACSMVLPPKSVLCMPCHVATFSIQDTVSLLSLLVFCLGMVGMCLVWFSGRTGERFKDSAGWALENGTASGGSESVNIRSLEGRSAEESARAARAEVQHRKGRGGVFSVLAGLIADVLLQRRLYRLSPLRWGIHGLIVFPMFARFAFGLVALVFSLVLPNVPLTSAMLDKNRPAVAFLFDITGLLILAGVALALVRYATSKETDIAELPDTGWGMSALCASVVAFGFVLEGMRIAMTGWPQGAACAFVGNGFSLLFKGMGGLADGYGYVWYIHAVLVGLFVAMIPFTRMSHIIMAPLVMIANAMPGKNED